MLSLARDAGCTDGSLYLCLLHIPSLLAPVAFAPLSLCAFCLESSRPAAPALLVNLLALLALLVILKLAPPQKTLAFPIHQSHSRLPQVVALDLIALVEIQVGLKAF